MAWYPFCCNETHESARQRYADVPHICYAARRAPLRRELAGDQVTYHWLETGNSVAGLQPINTNYPDLVINVPAGGIVRRMLITSNAFQLIDSARDVTSLSSAMWFRWITMDGVFPSGTLLYKDSRALRSSITTLYDIATVERIYTQTFELGDHELEVDQGNMARGSYRDAVGHSYHLRVSLQGFGGWGSGLQGAYSQYNFRVLYQVLP